MRKCSRIAYEKPRSKDFVLQVLLVLGIETMLREDRYLARSPSPATFVILQKSVISEAYTQNIPVAEDSHQYSELKQLIRGSKKARYDTEVSPAFKHIHSPPDAWKDVRMCRANDCQPHLNVTTSHLCRQSIDVERKTTCCGSEFQITSDFTTLRGSSFKAIEAVPITANVSMNLFLPTLSNSRRSRYHDEDSAGLETGPSTKGRELCQQTTAARISVSLDNHDIVSKFSVRLLRFIEARLKEWIPEHLQYIANPARTPRKQNLNDFSHIREWPPREPRDIESRKPTNESEPAHRKCSVGKRKRMDRGCDLSKPMMTPRYTAIAIPGTTLAELTEFWTCHLTSLLLSFVLLSTIQSMF